MLPAKYKCMPKHRLYPSFWYLSSRPSRELHRLHQPTSDKNVEELLKELKSKLHEKLSQQASDAEHEERFLKFEGEMAKKPVQKDQVLIRGVDATAKNHQEGQSVPRRGRGRPRKTEDKPEHSETAPPDQVTKRDRDRPAKKRGGEDEGPAAGLRKRRM